MNKSVLFDRVEAVASPDKRSSTSVVDAVLDGIISPVLGCGMRALMHRTARVGAHLHMGEPVNIAALNDARFAPSSRLKGSPRRQGQRCVQSRYHIGGERRQRDQGVAPAKAAKSCMRK